MNFVLLMTLALFILLGMLYLGISKGGQLMALALFTVIIGGELCKRIHPFIEAYFENIVICFLLYNSYYFYNDIDPLPLVGLAAIFVQRVTLFTFTFRHINFIWSIILYTLPVASAFLVVIDYSPSYQIPLPNPYEMKIAGFGMILISTAISIHTVRWFRKTIINIEQREKRVNSSYKQVLELNQILNHNLRTPLATAIGQLEIAERSNNGRKYVIQAKEALSQVTIQTSSVNNAKKAFEATANINEFLIKWKKIYDHDFVKLEIPEDQNKYELTEEVAIALAVSFDIFAKNSKEAGATELLIKVKKSAKNLQIELIDNGSGAPSEIIQKFGKPMASNKEHGTGIGTYLAQRLLISAGAHIRFSNRKNRSGFKVSIEV